MSVYESLTRGLNEAIEYEKGTITLRSNSMTISELEEFSARDIKNIRRRTGLSQTAFATAMGVSKKAVEAWECGRNCPAGTAKRLLAFAEENPLFFEKAGIVSFERSNETSNPIVYLKTESAQIIEYTVPIFAAMPMVAPGVCL